jgi:hypothetical protein
VPPVAPRVEPEPAPVPPVAPRVETAAVLLTAPVEAPASLEQRVRRLEDAMAAVQDVQQLEDRVLRRLAAQLGVPMPETRRDPPPGAVTGSPPTPAPAEKRPGSPPPELIHRVAAAARPTPQPWFLFDLYAEGRSILRMFVDPRYRMSWSGRLLPLLLLLAVLTSGWWLAVVPVLGPLLVKPVDLVLAFVLFKALGREARRYRETSPDLPPALRL